MEVNDSSEWLILGGYVTVSIVLSSHVAQFDVSATDGGRINRPLTSWHLMEYLVLMMVDDC